MAGKHGGAWKVAYADFVTAMMAFFLVMWICGQDQQIKRAVAYYFNDPSGVSVAGSKKPVRTGALFESPNMGTVPKSESVVLGRGRHSYSNNQQDSSPPTKMVGDWIHTDEKIHGYWRDQAGKQRAAAANSKEVRDDHMPIDDVAVKSLAKQLREEFARNIPAQAKGIYQDLLTEMLAEVNWSQLAEDLLFE